MAGEILVSYEELLEYLADREGDDATVSSHPVYGNGVSMLGLEVKATLGKIEAVEQHMSEAFLKGRAGARLRLEVGTESGHLEQLGELVLTREWFGGARLDDGHAILEVLVFANPDGEPLHPPVGQERDPDERRDVSATDLVGWGFMFDFDGSAPLVGRWARHEGA